MFVVLCKSCGKDLNSKDGRSQCCGCSNMTSIVGDRITAKDLGLVVIVNSNTNKNNKTSLSDSDMAWQESRSRRKIRKLDFEVR